MAYSFHQGTNSVSLAAEMRHLSLRSSSKALLDEAGWKDEDGDGIREAHGVEGVEEGTPLSLNMNGYTGYSTLELIELAVQGEAPRAYPS